MLTIECTKDLAKELNVPLEKIDLENIDPRWAWHTHLFILNRRKCVILMNNKSRYTIFLYGLKKPEFRNFSALLSNVIMENLKSEGFEESVIRKYLDVSSECVFTKTHDRSILGQINDMIYMTHAFFGDYYPTEVMNIIELNKRNNRITMVKMKHHYPIDALREMLEARV